MFMKIAVRGSALVAAAGCVAFLGQATQLSAQGKTTADGVFSDAQAQKGKATYTRRCSACHQEDLSGADEPMPAPALTGDKFMTHWGDQGLNVLYEKMSTTMPADQPGSLSPEEYADIMAFVLQFNKVPAGQGTLKGDAEALKAITFKKP